MISDEQKKAIIERVKLFIRKERLEPRHVERGEPYLFSEYLTEFVLHEIRVHQFFEKERQAEWDRGYTRGYEDGKNAGLVRI